MTARDLSDLEEVETIEDNTSVALELRRLQNEVRARDDFIAVLAHELRNPVSALHLQAETLLLAVRRAGDAVPASIVTRVESLRRQSGAFVKQASTLLDVSRAAAGKLSLDAEPCELVASIRSAIESVRGELELRKISIRFSAPPAIDGVWDPVRLEQIVFNLLSNAIKYGDAKPIYVGARGTAGHAVIIVRDRGVGISAADKARIFERFARGKEKQKEAGFGVGLWLVRSIVDAMGGTIDVRSVVGKGSTFVVRLPRSRSRSETDA